MNYAFASSWYPFDQFPPDIWQALNVVQCQVQSAPALVGTMAIGVMSEAVQGIADVQIPQGPRCPTSTWVLGVVDSGGGKTPTLNMLRHGSVQAWEARRYQEHAVLLEQYEIDHQAWKLELDELSSDLRKAVRKKQDTSDAKQYLAAHMLAKPEKPRRLKLSYSDATVEALLHGMGEFWPNVALPIDEASIFFNGHMANGLPLLNQSWDGHTISIDRRSQDEPILIDQPRATLILGIQTAQLQKYFKRRGSEGRDLGTMARMLVCCPPDNQGYRNVSPIELDQRPLDVFHQRVQALLTQSVGEDGEPIAQKRLVEFSPEAAERFHNLREQIEWNIRPFGCMADVRDYAAKATRHVAKLAAIFEIFENDSDVIGLEMLERAINLIDWHIKEYQRLFALPPEIPQCEQDADLLLPWLYQFANHRGNRYLMRNDIRKHAPNSIRSKDRLMAALQVLCQRGQVGLWQLERISYVDMQPTWGYDPAALSVAIGCYRNRRGLAQ
ncbi:YfjI family protein [Craterilacuibacter sp. RT1T]|uniref:YfjI family protein n=1 Tax=Craterilacuibacter sp. RT1T TaxID=2942211 RepID=UPI0020BE1C76|nr:YfjI family protein [Craterilacuibacter sp. RT1T]MCL6264488.1 YfjI family protein [Craterilacuibacter sp. RT1T]